VAYFLNGTELEPDLPILKIADTSSFWQASLFSLSPSLFFFLIFISLVYLFLAGFHPRPVRVPLSFSARRPRGSSLSGLSRRSNFFSFAFRATHFCAALYASPRGYVGVGVGDPKSPAEIEEPPLLLLTWHSVPRNRSPRTKF
jgi:hypothetical protein